MRNLRYEALAFRPDASLLAVSAPNGELALWNTAVPASPVPAGRLRMGHGIVAAAWNPAAASLLATKTSDGTVAVWRLLDDRRPECVGRWAGPADRARFIGWVAEGRGVFSMSVTGDTVVWDARSGDLVGTADLSDGRPVVATHYRGDGVVAITAGGWARLWRPGREPGAWIRLTDAPVKACAWSSRLLVIAAGDGRLTCYDPGFRPVGNLRIAPERLDALACSDDGRLVASFHDGRVIGVDRDGTLRWETSMGAVPARSMAIAGDLIALACRPPRPTLLALSNGTAVGGVTG